MLARYFGFEPGTKVKLFQREWTVVGVLDAICRNQVTLAITHNPAEYAGWREWRTAMRA